MARSRLCLCLCLRLRAAGQATVEYLYVLPILLLLLLASLQFAFVYEAKQTLNYATFAATRADALNGGAMVAIRTPWPPALPPCSCTTPPSRP